MPMVAEQADQLQFQIGGVESVHLKPIGTVPGVTIVQVAARCAVGTGFGVGTGYLKSEQAASLRWKAPNGAYGEAVTIPADGSYLLLDDDPDRWIRVSVDVSELQPGIVETFIALYDIYNNDAGQADISAAAAAAGDTLTWTTTLVNAGVRAVTDVRVWIDPAATDLSISDDGATWVSPTTEGAALLLSDLAPSASDTLHIRRVIGAGSTSNPKVTNFLHVRFDGH